MAIVAKWSGDGLAAGPMTESSVGPGDLSFYVNAPALTSIVSSGLRSPRIQFATGVFTYLSWGTSRMNYTFSECAVRIYAEFSDWPTDPFTTLVTARGPGDRWIIGFTDTGRLQFRDGVGGIVADSGTSTIPLNTFVRIEATVAADGGVVLKASSGDATSPLFQTNGSGLTTPGFTGMRIGNTSDAITVPTHFIDDLMVSDTAVFIGAPSAPSPTGGFSYWDGTTETSLTLEGVFDGTSVVPVEVEGGSTPTSKQILVGAQTEPSNLSQFTSDDASCGPWTVHRAFDSSGFPATFADSSANWDVGRWATVYSCKPDMVALAAGSLDSDITAFLQSIPQTHPTFVTVWHEADVKLKQDRSAYTVAEYKAGWQHFFQLVRDLSLPNVYTTLIFGNYIFISPQAGLTLDDFWPGDDANGVPYVDVLGFDGYTYNYESGDYLWGNGVAFAQSKGVDWGIAEIGFSTDITDPVAAAAWMHEQVEYCLSHGTGRHGSAAYLCWFNTTVGGVLKCPSAFPETEAASAEISERLIIDYKSYML